MKKLLTFLVSLTFVFGAAGLVACGGGDNSNTSCTKCVDTDGDFICDACGEVVLEEEKEVSVTFTVKDQDENKVANISITFTKENGTPVTATSGADGTFTATLKTGKYQVMHEYDMEVVGGYYQLETAEITVTESTAALDLYLQNTTPNGTAGREFPLSIGEENQVSIPAKTSYHYVVYRAVNLYVEIVGQDVSLSYGGQTYNAGEDGKISVALSGSSTNSVETFVIENLADSAQTFAVNINSAPGTQSNPFALVLGEDVTTEVLESREDVYYSFTATSAGTLTIAVKSENSYLSMTNTSNSLNANTNDDEDGDGVISLGVNEGDVVVITCTVILTGGETGSVTFNATFTQAE